jgi:hypothetical protein
VAIAMAVLTPAAFFGLTPATNPNTMLFGTINIVVFGSPSASG